MRRQSTTKHAQHAQVFEFPTGKPRNGQTVELVPSGGESFSSTFDTSEVFDLNSHLILHPASTYFIRATGNQMYHAGIRKGDILIVDLSLKCEPGDIVLAGREDQPYIEHLAQHAQPFGIRGKVLYSIHAIRGSASDETGS